MPVEGVPIHLVERARRLEALRLIQKRPHRTFVVVVHRGELLRPVLIPEQRLFNDCLRPLAARDLHHQREVAVNAPQDRVVERVEGISQRVDRSLSHHVPIDGQLDLAAIEVLLDEFVRGLPQKGAA